MVNFITQNGDKGKSMKNRTQIVKNNFCYLFKKLLFLERYFYGPIEIKFAFAVVLQLGAL